MNSKTTNQETKENLKKFAAALLKKKYFSKIAASNFPSDIREDEIRNHFRNLGEVRKIDLCCKQLDTNTLAVVTMVRPVSLELAQSTHSQIRNSHLKLRKYTGESVCVPSRILCHSHRRRNTVNFLAHLHESSSVVEQLDVCSMAGLTPHEEMEASTRISTAVRLFVRACTEADDWAIERYGSRFSNLALRRADLDISLTRNSALDVNEKLALASSIYKKMKKNRKSWRRVMFISSRNCPLVSFTDVETGLHVDVTFQNRRGLANSLLLRMFSREARFKKVILFLKLWSIVQEVCCPERHGGTYLNSLSLCMICLFAITRNHPGLVPKMSELAEKVSGTTIVSIDGIEFQQVPASAVLPPSLDTGTSAAQLTHEFFKYCSEEKWESFALDMLDSTVVEKSLLAGKPEFKDLKVTAMTVIHPYDRSNNLTANVDAKMIQKFVSACTCASQVVQPDTTPTESAWGLEALLHTLEPLPVFLRSRPAKRPADDV